MSEEPICMLQYQVTNLTANYVYRLWEKQLPSIRNQNVSGHPGLYQGAQNNTTRSTTGLRICRYQSSAHIYTGDRTIAQKYKLHAQETDVVFVLIQCCLKHCCFQGSSTLVNTCV